MRQRLAVSLLFAMTACAQTPSNRASGESTDPFVPGVIDNNPFDNPNDPGTGAQLGCNGWDDDDDSAIDEADEYTSVDRGVIGDGTCTSANGNPGLWYCVGGRWECAECLPQGDLYQLGGSCALTSGSAGTLWCDPGGSRVCRQCAPGETRNMACPCGGVVRVDACGDNGTWQLGTCDSCAPPAADPCTAATACKPGQESLRRCDDPCDPAVDPGCGSACRGEKLRCNDNCTWQVIEPCTSREKECDRDGTLTEPCARCGSRSVECDGCFWNRSTAECTDKGVCTPGDQHPTPCLTESCASGLVGGAQCNTQCQWEPMACFGCVLGDAWTTTRRCVSGSPDCGEQTVFHECHLGTQVALCGASLPVGEPVVVGVDESACDYDPASTCRNNNNPGCTPCGGHYQSCPGACGAGTQWCDQCCGCDACVSSSGACTPGQEDTQGCPYCGTRTRTCGGDCQWGGWTTCPATCGG